MSPFDKVPCSHMQLHNAVAAESSAFQNKKFCYNYTASIILATISVTSCRKKCIIHICQVQEESCISTVAICFAFPYYQSR